VDASSAHAKIPLAQGQPNTSGKVIGGSAQRSIRLSGESSMPDRAENDFAIVRAVARVVPLHAVNEKLRLGPAASSDGGSRRFVRAGPSQCQLSQKKF
jgi:hypothetical protein